MQVQKKAHRDQERNLGVDGLLIDVDFAGCFAHCLRKLLSSHNLAGIRAVLAYLGRAQP